MLNLAGNVDCCRTINDLFRDMARRWANRNIVEKAMRDLESVQQRPDEDFTSFIGRYDTLRALTPAVPESTEMYQIRSKLNARYQARLMNNEYSFHKVSDLREFLQTAELRHEELDEYQAARKAANPSEKTSTGGNNAA